MMVIKEDQLQWFIIFLIKSLKRSGIINEPNYQLASELHKPIIRKFKKRKFYSFFRDNIWGVHLLCKYAWVIPMKDKKVTSIVNAFKKIISKGRKPNKIWVD